MEMNNAALLFPGQGSQFVGMGKVLYEQYPLAREIFDEANETLGMDLKKLCFEGGMEELTRTENTQPAILTASFAAYKVLVKETGLQPKYFAGHSLGEISALTAAGAIKFSDAINIVRKRGLFMQEAVPAEAGAMSAVSGVDSGVIEECCNICSAGGNLVTVSNYNSPDQIVVSGHKTAVDEIGRLLSEKGGRVIKLKVSAPFHCSLMQQAADRLREELSSYHFMNLKYPVVSNVTALEYPDKDSIVDTLSLQIVKPVLWTASMEYILRNGVNTMIEVGPQSVLKKLMGKINNQITSLSMDNEDDFKKVKALFIKRPSANSAREAKLKFITKCIAITVSTRNRNWDNEEYRKGVIEPYREVCTLLNQIEREDAEPELEHVEKALNMLRTVFETKKTPSDEQKERFHRLFEETGIHNIFPALRGTNKIIS
jgi:[acyl-carrier-protein] S-malonyltransferase